MWIDLTILLLSVLPSSYTLVAGRAFFNSGRRRVVHPQLAFLDDCQQKENPFALHRARHGPTQT